MALRAELEAFAAEQGAEALFERCEVWTQHPQPVWMLVMCAARFARWRFAWKQVSLSVPSVGKVPPPYAILELALTMDRDELQRRLNERIDRMMAAGLLDEVKGLIQRGYGWHLPSMSGLGYAQLGSVIRGEATLEEA